MDNVIERVFEFKYLGIIFDPCMKFTKHFLSVQSKISHRLKYLYGIKRFLSKNVMVIMINAYVHSVIDYGLDIWAVQSTIQLSSIQDKIDRFLVSFFLPGLMRRTKKCYNVMRRRINVQDMWSKCNFTSIHERLDFVTIKNLFKDYCQDKLTFSQRSQIKSMPLLVIPTFSSVIYKNSLKY